MEKYISIGYTKKTKGVKGELKIEVEDIYWEDFQKSTVVFLLQKGKEMPFFIEKIIDGKELLLKLEDIDSKEAAHELTSKEMFLRASDVSEKEEVITINSDLQFGHLVNYQIKDQTLGNIGVIEEVLEFPQQEMAILFIEEKEILIPLNEILIEEIDEKNRVVVMNLPEGILEL